MVETLKNLFVDFKGSIISDGDCHMKDSLYRSIDFSIGRASNCKEDVPNTPADRTPKQILVSTPLDGTFEYAIVMERVIAADEGEGESSWTLISYFLEITDRHLRNPNQSLACLSTNNTLVFLVLLLYLRNLVLLFY